MNNKKCISSIALVLAMTSAFSIFASGCNSGRGGYEEKIDTKKTQLFIQNYDGGGGSQWLYDVKDKFEEKYKDYLSPEQAARANATKA